MRFLYLIWKNLGRRKLRTVLTVLSTMVAFLLFGVLAAVRMGFRAGVDVTGADRMAVTHKVSIIMPLPISYMERIQAVPGVVKVSHANWFGGIYQDPKNFFPQLAIDDNFFPLYPEYRVPPDQMKAWMADRTGAIVGRSTAERFGWKIGDRVPIQGTIFRRRDGSPGWEFTVSGIHGGAQKETDTTGFYFHYDYLKEAALGGDRGLIGWYIIKIADPARADEVSRRIDSMFANSPAETKTQTEKALAQGFANQVGNVGALITGIVLAVFLILLLVVGNTMALSIRERTGELAVLRTLGFSQGQVLGMVLAESCLMALVGGLLGLGLALLVVPGIGAALRQFLPVVFIPPRDLALGGALILLLGLAAGLPPAFQAMRLRIIDALRRV